jgi:UDP:flavonoid glycosyltransferase YjiC (YdhE family)
MRRVIAGLSGIPVRVVVTAGPAMAREKLPTPRNVVIVDSAPHNQVLPQTALMVTHAGHGSVVRALAHDRPLVCVPMGRDQNDIAARVVYHGAGVRVSPNASATAFRNAILRVLKDDRYTEAAQRLGAEIRRDAQSNSAINELEALAQGATSGFARLPAAHAF